MNTKSEIITKIKEIKPLLLADYSVKSIGLFGSYVHETNTEQSDIDILVEFEKPIGWRFFTLELYLERIFGCKVDLVTKSGLKDQIKNQILAELEYV
ncbi:MAG: nucleotidyltransferase family protein [Bacteroidales bacterium]